MSSWLGHILGTLVIARPPRTDPSVLGAVAFLAIAPDLLEMIESTGHAILSTVLLGVAVSMLVPAAHRGRCVAAALSHLGLDLLAGCRDPLLSPFYPAILELPFGVLPAAPGLSLDNPYLYRNLALEVLIFVPPFAAWWWGPRSGLVRIALTASMATGLVISTFVIR
jgi:hypothetical protein